MKEITVCCFKNCNQLKSVEFSLYSELELIDHYCFSNASIESIYIHSNVKKILIGSFYMCEKLKYVHFNINSELKIIGEYEFYFCRNLKIIEISKSSELELILIKEERVTEPILCKALGKFNSSSNTQS